MGLGLSYLQGFFFVLICFVVCSFLYKQLLQIGTLATKTLQCIQSTSKISEKIFHLAELALQIFHYEQSTN